MSRLFACLVIAACAGPAAACVNDSELPSHEREFRSQYGKPTPPPQSPAPTSAEPVSAVPTAGLLAGGVGVVLLAGATLLTWRGTAARG